MGTLRLQPIQWCAYVGTRTNTHRAAFVLTFLPVAGLLLSGFFSSPRTLARPLPTGQTTERVAGDDGTYQTGYVYPGNRFVDNGDLTFYDNATGLMWTQRMRRHDGSSFVGNAVSQSAAVADCLATTVAGYDDWRLPTPTEMMSLMSVALAGGFVCEPTCTDVIATTYWTSTAAEWGTPGTTAMLISNTNYRVIDGGNTASRNMTCVRLGR